MSAVWAEAASTIGRLGLRVADLTVTAEIVTNAVFDPAGATRCETAILEAAVGPHGLAMLAAKLAADAALLRAVVAKEQLVDDFPIRQLAALEASLVTLPLTALRDPARATRVDCSALRRTCRRVRRLRALRSRRRFSRCSRRHARFRFDAVTRRPVSVDPVLGLPLAAAVPRERARRWKCLDIEIPTRVGPSACRRRSPRC